MVFVTEKKRRWRERTEDEKIEERERQRRKEGWTQGNE